MSWSSYWAEVRTKFSTNDYNLLPTQEDGSVQLKPHFTRYFQSRRLQLSALASVIPFLLLLTYIFLPVRSTLNAQPVDDESSASPSDAQSPASDGIDWSRYAYVQYATNQLYLCNSVMLFEILHRLESKANRLLMYPSHFLAEEGDSASETDESRLLKKARDEYDVKLQPIEVQSRSVGDRELTLTDIPGKAPTILTMAIATWAESYTKLLAFNQTQYDRVLSLDSDSTVLQVCCSQPSFLPRSDSCC